MTEDPQLFDTERRHFDEGRWIDASYAALDCGFEV
jgi:hypothetical protein